MTQPQLPMPSKQYLERLYYIQGLSMRGVCRVCGCSISPVRRLFKLYGIKQSLQKRTKTNTPRPKRPTKQELHRLYWDEKMSSTEVSLLYGCHPTTIMNWLRVNHIPLRTKTERQLLAETREHNHPLWERRRKANKSVCTTLVNHIDMMHDDPERMSSAFLLGEIEKLRESRV